MCVCVCELGVPEKKLPAGDFLLSQILHFNQDLPGFNKKKITIYLKCSKISHTLLGASCDITEAKCFKNVTNTFKTIC